jgi:hypothetical protein
MADYKVKLTQTTPNFTLKNTTISQYRIDKMSDVVESSATRVDGAILVYDLSSDTYILRDILTYDNGSDSFKVDGGGF